MRSTLIVTLAVLLVSCAAQAATIDEISVDSVDTQFTPAPNPTLTMYQQGVTVVIERAGNVQDSITGATFSFWTYLQTDKSAAGQALGDFTGGGIAIYDALNVPLLLANVGQFSLEESTGLPITVLAGSGNFAVTGGTWAQDFVPDGVILDLTWKVTDGTGAPANISDFSSAFLGESDLTLTVPEPATLGLLAMGGLALIRRRRRASAHAPRSNQ